MIDFRDFKANIGDKPTTISGIIIACVGLIIVILPFFPQFIEMDAEQYAALLGYAKFVGGAMIILGLFLIGAVRSDEKE